MTSVAKVYCNHGIDGIITIKRSLNSDIARLKLGAREEAILISMACTPPPYTRWTAELCTAELNRRMDEFGFSSHFSKSSVWRALNRNQLKPHLSEYWYIPEVTSIFTLRMELLLHTYSLP